MNGKQPRFSVITSSYNQLGFLRKAKPHWEAQTFDNFEWIIADDGSDDDTANWYQREVLNNGLPNRHWFYVGQLRNGYGLIPILNKASRVASGEYLVWVMADTYPAKTFLSELDKVVSPQRVVTGLRMNVDFNNKDYIVSLDWRLTRELVDLQETAHQITRPIEQWPWELMTLNGMCMPKAMFNEMGGIYDGYKGYGRMDTDMAMWAKFNGYELWWACQAWLKHRNHEDREDTPENVALFNKRYEEFKNSNRIR